MLNVYFRYISSPKILSLLSSGIPSLYFPVSIPLNKGDQTVAPYLLICYNVQKLIQRNTLKINNLPVNIKKLAISFFNIFPYYHVILWLFNYWLNKVEALTYHERFKNSCRTPFGCTPVKCPSTSDNLIESLASLFHRSYMIVAMSEDNVYIVKL